MLESQTAPISEFSQWHSTQLSQRSRPFNIRIKPRKVDIEDYDLSTLLLIQEKQSVREVLERSVRLFTN